MTYSTAKLEQSSEKFFLIKMQGTVDLNDKLTPDTGFLYQVENLDYSIYSAGDSVKGNGVVLNRVNYPPTTDGDYSYDDLTKTLTIYDSIGLPSNFYTFDFALYYSSSDSKEFGSDPANSPELNKVLWESRLTSAPSLKQDISNVIDGKLSVGISGFSIANGDGAFNKYLGNDVTFYNKMIEGWHVIDSVANINSEFNGEISDIKSSQNSVDFSIREITYKFNNDCVMDSLCVAGEQSGSVYRENIQPTKIEQPLKFFYGKFVGGFNKEEATCYDFNQNLSVTVNRSWALGVVTENVEDYSCTPSNVTHIATDFTRCTVTSGELAKFEVGDQVNVLSPGLSFNRVLNIDTVNNYLFISYIPTMTTGHSLQYVKVPVLKLVYNDSTGIEDNRFLTEGQSFDSFETLTADGNYIVHIVFYDDFESGIPSFPSPLNPEEVKVYFKIKPPHDKQNHSDILKSIIEKAGFLTDASFATAKTDLLKNLAFTIPLNGSSQMPSYSEVIENILKSTLGYIYRSNPITFGYKLFELPTGGTEINSDDIINGTFTITQMYDDIETRIVAYNLHTDENYIINLARSTVEDLESYYKYGVQNTTNFVHLLEDITTRIDAHIGLKSKRKSIYNFSTTGKLFDSKLGDDIVISRDLLPANAPSVNAKIVGLEKTPYEVKVTAIDLYGL